MTTGKTISSEGRYFDNKNAYRGFTDHIDVNVSDILSELIREAGRVCDHYASDIFHDWHSFMEIADRAVSNFYVGNNEKDHPTGVAGWIGFRKNGVDSFFLRNDQDTEGRVDKGEKDPDYFTRYIVKVSFLGSNSVKVSLTRFN